MKKTIIAFLLASIATGTAFAQANTKNTSTEAKNVSTPLVTKAADNKVVVIRIAHVVKANTPKGKSALRFKELLEAKFPGRVKVDVYEDNKLFEDREEIEALDLGAVDLIIPSTVKVATSYEIKDFEIFDLPFLFSSNEDVIKFTQSDTARKLMDSLAAKSKYVQPVALWPNDFRTFVGQKAFKQPEDFKGLKVRLESNGTITKKMYENFGTSETIPLAFSDLYKSLKKEGKYKVDAADNVVTNLYASKLYEAAPYITVSNHSFLFYAVLANKRWLNSLPDDIRNGVIQVAQDTASYHLQISQKDNETMLREMELKGAKIYRWTENERENFKKAVVPVHDAYLKNINKDLLLETYQLLKQK